MTNYSIREYDLNVFYKDLGINERTGENEWADVYTIQPSAYFVEQDTFFSDRTYLEAFDLTLAETRMLAPDFPIEEWGDDFFITLESFVSIAKAIPDRVSAILSTLPPIEEVPRDVPEYAWISTLF